MKFDDLISNFLSEKKESTTDDEPPVPFAIEITRDLNQHDAYNELGEIIIKLSVLRNKLQTSR